MPILAGHAGEFCDTIKSCVEQAPRYWWVELNDIKDDERILLFIFDVIGPIDYSCSVPPYIVI